jgi:hypothetical protein
MLATRDTSGILINDGANDGVNLRGLDIDGADSAADGILFNSGGSLRLAGGLLLDLANGRI